MKKINITEDPRITTLMDEMTYCAKERAKLNEVIRHYELNYLCYEKERLEHNRLLSQELIADEKRMRILMETRRLALREGIN